MKTLAEHRDDLTKYRAEAARILDTAKAEEREPTTEEDSRLAELCGSGTPGVDGYSAGMIADTTTAIAKAERYEQRLTEADATLRGNRPAPIVSASEPVSRPQIIVPGNRKTVLKNFKGENAEANAYSSGQWFLAITGNQKCQKWCQEHGISIVMAGSEGSDSLGGYLVPEQFESAIIELREERGVFRRHARREPMTSDTKTIPRRAGGVTMYYVGENTEITASDKTWDSIKLTARKAGVLTKYSSELNEDSVISIADNLAEEIGYAFANGEDSAGFNGDGTSTYGGINGLKTALAAGSIYTAITGNTAFSTLDLDDFEGMMGMLPLYALQDAAWYISRAGWAASMLRLAAAAGGNTMDNIAGSMQPTFLGYPVRFAQVMNSTLTAQTSTNGLAYFGSLRQGVAFGDRRGISLATSMDRYFELDQLAIKGTQRFDIVVHETGTASVAGSIISLKTPSS